MRVIELASPFGVFVIGVIILAIGYSLYLAGLSVNDPIMRDSSAPLESLGVVLMMSGVLIYLITVMAKRVFK